MRAVHADVADVRLDLRRWPIAARDCPGIVGARSSTVVDALFARVVDVAGIHPERPDRIIAAGQYGLVDEIVIVGPVVTHVEVCLARANREIVIGDRHGLVAAERELSGRATAAGVELAWTTIAAAADAAGAEGVADANQPMVAEVLLPLDPAVVARAGRTRRVEDQLLEIIDVGVATFFHGHLGRTVGVTPVLGKIAGQRVLAAQSDLAEI